MLRGLRVLIVSVVVFAGLVAPARPAGAAAVCTVNITFAYAPGITVVPGPTAVTGTMVLNCPVLTPDAGMWTLPFAGPAGFEACEGGTGVMAFGAGAVGPPGAVGGVFTYAHAYAGSTAILGTIAWPGNTRTLVATGEWLPVLLPGDCVTAPVTGGFMTGVGALA